MDNMNSQDQTTETKDELVEVGKLKLRADEIPKPEEKVDTAKPKSENSAPAPATKSAPVPAAVHAVVSGEATDAVHLSKCIYKNAFARKSLTVHHVQRRLVELGYKVVDSDKDGWYGDMTKLAVSQFQVDNGTEGDGVMDAATFSDLFAGDHNVTVVID
jgi:peptidoglycan hydrolase-like protein with peptidoglycan-binding domain